MPVLLTSTKLEASSILQKHAFWTIRNQNLNPIVQKSVFLNNRDYICPKNIKIKFGALMGHKFKTYVFLPIILNWFLIVYILIYQNFFLLYSYEAYPL